MPVSLLADPMAHIFDPIFGSGGISVRGVLVSLVIKSESAGTAFDLVISTRSFLSNSIPDIENKRLFRNTYHGSNLVRTRSFVSGFLCK